MSSPLPDNSSEQKVWARRWAQDACVQWARKEARGSRPLLHEPAAPELTLPPAESDVFKRVKLSIGEHRLNNDLPGKRKAASGIHRFILRPQSWRGEADKGKHWRLRHKSKLMPIWKVVALMAMEDMKEYLDSVLNPAFLGRASDSTLRAGWNLLAAIYSPWSVYHEWIERCLFSPETEKYVARSKCFSTKRVFLATRFETLNHKPSRDEQLSLLTKQRDNYLKSFLSFYDGGVLEMTGSLCGKYVSKFPVHQRIVEVTVEEARALGITLPRRVS